MSRGREILYCCHGEYPRTCIKCKNLKLEQQLKETQEKLDQANDDWCKKHEQQLELMEKLTQLDREIKTKQRKIEYQQQIIENLKTEMQDQKALIKSLRERNK